MLLDPNKKIEDADLLHLVGAVLSNTQKARWSGRRIEYGSARYRERVDFQRDLLMHRYSFIDAMKRIQSEGSRGEDQIRKAMEERYGLQ